MTEAAPRTRRWGSAEDPESMITMAEFFASDTRPIPEPLLERSVRDDIAALKGLAKAAAEKEPKCQNGCDGSRYREPLKALRAAARHPGRGRHIRLHSLTH